VPTTNPVLGTPPSCPVDVPHAVSKSAYAKIAIKPPNRALTEWTSNLEPDDTSNFAGASIRHVPHWGRQPERARRDPQPALDAHEPTFGGALLSPARNERTSEESESESGDNARRDVSGSAR